MGLQILECQDCGDDFEFTDGEQQFFLEKDFPKPIRCKACRMIKKKKKEEDPYEGISSAFMNNQNIYRGSLNTRLGRANKISGA